MFFTSLIIFLVACTASATPAAYDQRQTGDVNVQIHLKDVQVVALVNGQLLDDYTDYNYSYDYSDFTIKPIAKPSTASGPMDSAWHTWPTNSPSSTPKSNFTEEIASSNSNSTTILPSDVELTSSSGMGEDEFGLKRNSAKCPVGYTDRNKGGCKKRLRRRFSLIPFALRMLPKRPETPPLS